MSNLHFEQGYTYRHKDTQMYLYDLFCFDVLNYDSNKVVVRGMWIDRETKDTVDVDDVVVPISELLDWKQLPFDD